VRYFLTAIFIFLFSVNYGQPRDLRFKHITVEDGLSQNWVKAIIQDRYGFMWFGTGGNGICRFDGYEFKAYKNEPGNVNTLVSNSINALYEKENGQLWVATAKGISIYNRDKDIFTRFPALTEEYITGFYNSEDGRFFIITANNIFELKGDKVIPFCSGQCIQSIFSGEIAKDIHGNHWIASFAGVYLVDLNKRTIKGFFYNKNDDQSILSNAVASCYMDLGNRTWIGNIDGGLNLMKFRSGDSNNPYFKRFMPSGKDANSIKFGTVRTFIDDSGGNLWLGLENGGLSILDLKKIDKGITSFSHYMNNPYDNTSISGNSIYCFYKDRQGTIWIGTYDHGISYYNKLLFQFEHYRNIAGNKNSINNNIINSIVEDGNYLWIGTEAGLNRMNKFTGENIVYKYDPDNPNSISSNAIMTLFKDANNDIWVGTWAGGLNKLNKKTNTFARFRNDPLKPNSISNDNIFAIQEDNKGFIYIGTMGGGLNRYDTKSNTFKTYWNIQGSNNSLPNNWVQNLLMVNEKELWVATADGVGIFNSEKETFINFRHDPANPSSLSYSNANALFKDSKGNVWVGTDAGLNLFLRNSNSFKYFSQATGLPDNSIKAICEDDKGNLWISTNNGISEFINGINVPQKPIFRNFGLVDGLQGNEFCRKSALKGSDGKLYFGGYNGFNAFYPESIRSNNYVPDVIITDFLLFNKPVDLNQKNSTLKKNVNLVDEIIVSYNQSVLTFKFAATNYIYPEKNNYAYIMEGFEKNWNYVGNKREATYTNLSPGEYTFRVIASNNNDVWNKKGVSLKIYVMPPWYKSWWFRVFLIALTTVMVYTLYNLRLRLYKKRQKELKLLIQKSTNDLEEKNKLLVQRQVQIEKQDEEIKIDSAILKEANELLYERQLQIQQQAEQLKETNNQLSILNATKDRFFSIIAHDLRNPFNVVSGFSEILLRNIDKLPKEKVYKFLNMIHVSSTSGNSLLENLLQWSRSQTGRIAFEPVNINLAVIAEETIRLLSGEADRKSIELQQIIDDRINVMADENMLKTVLRNLVSNAIKFTDEKGKVTIKAAPDNSFAEISVTDTGIGITDENKEKLFRVDVIVTTKGTAKESGTGLGLILCKDFVERHNGKIWVESEVGKGSDFKFTIPLA
jgi:signal transduction histidine kinase/ligand-binding sensor domain-containing protein